jgi:hypothetical protein
VSAGHYHGWLLGRGSSEKPSILTAGQMPAAINARASKPRCFLAVGEMAYKLGKHRGSSFAQRANQYFSQPLDADARHDDHSPTLGCHGIHCNIILSPNGTGNIGIGTTTPHSRLTVWSRDKPARSEA